MPEGVSQLVEQSDRILQRERTGLARRIAALKERVAVHRGLLDELEVELAKQQRLLREVDELADRRPQLRLERLDKQLKGRRIQEVAVEILRSNRPDEVVHYREWFAMLRAEGFEIGGRDPLNTFLTSVGRADAVERLGGRSGLYRLA